MQKNNITITRVSRRKQTKPKQNIENMNDLINNQENKSTGNKRKNTCDILTLKQKLSKSYDLTGNTTSGPGVTQIENSKWVEKNFL